MSAILKEDQLKEINDGSEPVFEFYGGMVWKQIEYTSQYHHCNVPEEVADNEGSG